jgi:hypothetical protein
MRLYHREIGFPDTLRIPEGRVDLWYSVHARERIEGKYKGFLILPSFVIINKNNVIEVGTDNNITCNKVLVRTSYDNKKDICVVCNPYNGKVITLWTNYKNDKHETLDKSKYDIP